MVDEQLLDFESVTLITIFNYLKKQDHPCSIYKLIQSISYERRTILKYLAILQDFSTIVWQKLGVEPLKNEDNKFEIDGNNHVANKELELMIYHNSVKIQLIEDLLNKKYNNLNKLAKDYNISLSSLKKYVYELKTYFRNYSIELHVKQNHLLLAGHEPTIRLFFFNFCWKMYGGYTCTFDNQFEEKKQLLLDVLTLLLDGKIDPITRIQYEYLLSISFIRQYKGFKINSRDLPLESIINNNKLICYLKLKLRPFPVISLDINEIHFLLLYLQSKLVFYQNPSLFHMIKKCHQELNSCVFQANTFFLQHLGVLYHSIHSDQDKLEKELFAIHTQVILIVYYDYCPLETCMPFYLEDNQLIAQILFNRLSKLSPKNSFIYSDLKKVAQLYATLSIANQLLTKRSLTVFLDSSNGELTYNWLSTLYSDATKGLAKLNFIPPADFLYQKDVIDFVITTNEFLPNQQELSKIPIVYIDGNDKYQDLKKIYQMIQTILAQR